MNEKNDLIQRGPLLKDFEFCKRCVCGSGSMEDIDVLIRRTKAAPAYVERLKPLTWDEAMEDDSFLEIRGGEYMDGALNRFAAGHEGGIEPNDCIIFTTHDKDDLKLYGVDYGKTWRCWPRRPTEEERKAAKWRKKNAV